MTDPIEGRFGQLVMTAWVSDTRQGAQAVILLTTPDGRAPVTMPLVAEGLGLLDARSNVGVHLAVGDDGWLTLEIPGVDRYARPGNREVCDAALALGRAGLIVGYLPMPSGVDVDVYTASLFSAGAFAAGEVPARPAAK